MQLTKEMYDGFKLAKRKGITQSDKFNLVAYKIEKATYDKITQTIWNLNRGMFMPNLNVLNKALNSI